MREMMRNPGGGEWPAPRHYCLAMIPMVKAIVLALWTVVGSTLANAQDADSGKFRLVFGSGAGTRDSLLAGTYGPANRTELTRMVRSMLDWAKQPAVRFIFVAERTSLCDASRNCQPDMRMHERVTEAKNELGKLAQGQTLALNRIGQEFVDELLPLRVSLPPAPPNAPAGTYTLNLFIKVEAGRALPSSCTGRALLADPGAPPVIGATAGIPALPVAVNATTVVHAGAKLKLVQGPADRLLLAFWSRPPGALPGGPAGQSTQTTYAKADSALMDGGAIGLPAERRTLHLVATSAPAADLRTFMGQLTPDFRAISAVPALLSGPQPSVAGGRSIGDHVLVVPSTMLTVPDAPASDTEHCRLTFDPAK
jgi:hypothetical protein